MTEKNDAIIEIKEKFDLERIKNLSLSEKFKLAKLAKLIYTEALFANQSGIQNLDKSPNYTLNKTYNLFAMLVVNRIRYDVLQDIITNYAKNFKKSDSYYSQVSIIGIGLLLVVKDFDPKSILNYLMMILGEEFLINNQKYEGEITALTEEDITVKNHIDYEAFEGEMRKVKYELLALLELNHEKGSEFIAEIINNKYDERRMKFYYNMMNITNNVIKKEMYDEFNLNESRMNRLILGGAYAIHEGLNIFTAHYLFNSIIGKYSRYDKRVDEIQNEMKLRREEILSL